MDIVSVLCGGWSSRIRLRVGSATLGWAPCQGQVLRRVDQTNMGEGLRKIAELTPCPWVVLLSQEPYVVLNT